MDTRTFAPSTRRDVLKALAAGTAGAALGAVPSSAFAQDAAAPDLLRQSAPSGRDPFLGLKAGVATYSLRGLKVDAAIKAIQRVGMKYCSIKNIHLKIDSDPDQRRTIARLFRDAGVEPISCGV